MFEHICRFRIERKRPIHVPFRLITRNLNESKANDMIFQNIFSDIVLIGKSSFSSILFFEFYICFFVLLSFRYPDTQDPFHVSFIYRCRP